MVYVIIMFLKYILIKKIHFQENEKITDIDLLQVTIIL